MSSSVFEIRIWCDKEANKEFITALTTKNVKFKRKLLESESVIAVVFDHVSEIIAALALLYAWYSNRTGKPKVVVTSKGVRIEVYDKDAVQKIIDELNSPDRQ